MSLLGLGLVLPRSQADPDVVVIGFRQVLVGSYWDSVWTPLKFGWDIFII